MRGAVTILIFAFILALGDAHKSSTCAKGETKDELLPHERCNRFYHCVAGELIAQRCPADLRFNTKKQLCDWPDRVDCGDRDDNESKELPSDVPDKGTVNDDPSLAPIICAAEGSDGILISHEDCSKFYICANEKPVGMPCPKDLLYNPFKEQCDWPENVKCPVKVPEGDKGSSEDKDDEEYKGNYDPSKAREICAAEGSDGVLVAHELCNKFYICSSGIRITLRCPAGLLYNPRKEQCDYRKNVDCAKRIIPDPKADNDEDIAE